MSEAGQMREADAGEDFVGWVYYMFVILLRLPGWCDWDVIARVRLFCEVFSKCVSRTRGVETRGSCCSLVGDV